MFCYAKLCIQLFVENVFMSIIPERSCTLVQLSCPHTIIASSCRCRSRCRCSSRSSAVCCDETVTDTPIVTMGDYWETIYFKLNVTFTFDLAWPWKEICKVDILKWLYLGQMNRYRLENWWTHRQLCCELNATMHFDLGWPSKKIFKVNILK
jgi:hypothetical protein